MNNKEHAITLANDGCDITNALSTLNYINKNRERWNTTKPTEIDIDNINIVYRFIDGVIHEATISEAEDAIADIKCDFRHTQPDDGVDVANMYQNGKLIDDANQPLVVVGYNPTLGVMFIV